MVPCWGLTLMLIGELECVFFINGSWGFASNPDLDDSERIFPETVQRAVDLAKASAKVNSGIVELVEKPSVIDEWSSFFQVDPFEIDLHEKLRLLIDCTNVMSMVDGVCITKGSMDFMREKRFYMDSEGSEIEQKVLQSGAGISCLSLNGNEVHSRSYPSSFRGNHQMGVRSN